MRRSWQVWAFALCGLAGVGPIRAEFLFAPSDPTPNGFFTPTLDFGSIFYQYSAWDVFYAPHTAGNFPDIFAPYGGVEISPGVWAPETRSDAGFPTNPFYNPADALAFWDTRNATITQGATSAFIIGPDISGNIYTFSEKTSYVLANDPDYDQLGSVILQFQTDGSTVDFSQIKLVYSDGANTHEILALDAEYLREYHTTGSGHWSAAGGYANRVAIQWDMSGITDLFGNPITSYEIHWGASSSSMSLQKVDLITSDTYQAGMPIAATWTAGNGVWSNSANWSLHENSGLIAPQQNGNIRFQNTGAVSIGLDQNFTLGELSFENPGNVTISTGNNSVLASNTGVTTRNTATGSYSIDTGFVLGALNFFEINGGTVAMNGVISGGYGVVKSGAGTLLLNNNNTFTGFLGVQGGTVRVAGANAYTGGTTVINGRLIVAADAGATGALGSTASALSIGADEALYQYSGGGSGAELVIDGDHVISRSVVLAAGDNSKRLGAINTVNGAIYSGTINFTSSPADPDATTTAAGNVKLTAQNATDKLIFSGAMVGGIASKTVTIDGQGRVIYSGANKTYSNATNITGGALEIAAGTEFSGAGAVTVGNGAELIVHGSLSGTGSLSVNGGRLAGTGTIGREFTLNAGDMLAPGAGVGMLSTVAQTWENGGRFQLELTNAGGAPGLGWDVVNLTGALDLTANNSGFVLELRTLAAGGSAGWMSGFNPAQDYTWKFADTTAGLLNFAAADFTIDTTGFLNTWNGGSFFITQSNGDLLLNFQAIPEPSSTILLLASGALFLSRRFRRRVT